MEEREQVLVFPASLLAFCHYTNGFCKNKSTNDDQFARAIASSFFMDREEAEKNPLFKQIIPYCIIHQKEEDSYFVYQRTKKAGEQRLHGNWSIGIGGHVNPCDNFSYKNGLKRELKEEIGLEIDYYPEVIGTIFDNSNEVGKVHFGVVHLIEVEKGCKLTYDDESMDNGRFILVEDFEGLEFENWSKLVIKELI